MGENMIKLNSIITILICIVGLESIAWSQTNSPTVHAWSNVQPNDLPKDSIVGHTYIYNMTMPIQDVENCDLVFRQMDDALEHKLFYGGPLFGTSFMYCGTDPQEKPVQLFVQMGAEPRSLSDVDTFKEYLSRVQGRRVLGGEIRYSRLDQIIARTDLQATLVWDPRPNQAILHNAAKYDAFSSLADFYRYQSENRAQFWKPMDEFLPWVEAKWDSYTRKLFEYYALRRANSMMLDYERTYRMEDRTLIKNWLIEVGLFRDCRKNPDMHCL